MYGNIQDCILLTKMPLLSTQNEPKRAPLLTRDAWIEAALAVLIENGVHAIQITDLSKRLNVTRGSFYWHFESRDELLDALVAEWRARNTSVMVEALANSETLESGILDLFLVWVDDSRFDPKLDQAIRDWSRISAPLLDMVRSEDDERVGSIAAFFERQGYDSIEAFVRARVIYFTQLSYYALNIEESTTRRLSYLSAYFQCFTGKDIDRSVEDRFKTRLLEMEAKGEL